MGMLTWVIQRGFGLSPTGSGAANGNPAVPGFRPRSTLMTGLGVAGQGSPNVNRLPVIVLITSIQHYGLRSIPTLTCDVRA